MTTELETLERFRNIIQGSVEDLLEVLAVSLREGKAERAFYLQGKLDSYKGCLQLLEDIERH